MSRIAALVLAAGQGTRFRASGGAGPSKLVANLDGVPLVRHVVEAAQASRAVPVVVVTGHAREAIEIALAGSTATLVYNPDYPTGLASSLRAGIGALPCDVVGAVVLLGDMPTIPPDLIDALIGTAECHPEADAVVPVVAGRRGNPVLLSARLFEAVAELSGDAGARQLLRDPGLEIRELTPAGNGAVCDVDELDDLNRFASRPEL